MKAASLLGETASYTATYGGQDVIMSTNEVPEAENGSNSGSGDNSGNSGNSGNNDNSGSGNSTNP